MVEQKQLSVPRRLHAFRLLALVAVALSAASPALAHPHVFVDATVTPIFDATGKFSAIHEKWTFDQAFTEAAGPDLDVNHDGILETAEIQNAGGVGVLWFIPYGYFTRVTLAGQPVTTGTVNDFNVHIPGPQMVVEFTLPLAAPVPAPFAVGIDVFDPDIYVDVAFAEPGIDTSRLAPGCSVVRREAGNLDPFAMLLIRKLGLPADPTVLNDPASGFKLRILMGCT